MGKLEKLKEVNETIKNKIIELETHIFIENAYSNDNNKIRNNELNVAFETKQQSKLFI